MEDIAEIIFIQARSFVWEIDPRGEVLSASQYYDGYYTVLGGARGMVGVWLLKADIHGVLFQVHRFAHSSYSEEAE